MPRKHTYHSDMYLPWESLSVALEQIVRTGREARQLQVPAVSVLIETTSLL